MFIAGEYSFNRGKEFIESRYPHLLQEIRTVIADIDAEKSKTKESKEITMPGRLLYSPKQLNDAFKEGFHALGWHPKKEFCDYSTTYYVDGYHPKVVRERTNQRPFREMDFVKEKLGIEVQFGKYAFMVYNVCAKMTIFKKLGYINAGIEIVPVKQLVDEMSTGVSFFEQITWDLNQRGAADIDIPVLIYGIATGNLSEPVNLNSQVGDSHDPPVSLWPDEIWTIDAEARASE